MARWQNLPPKPVAKPKTPPRRKYGLNENYARELMELHTLGVDGGYTQQDVTEVARVLTGWTSMPYGNGRKNVNRAIANGNKNLVREGEFLFRNAWHDKKAKVVLGETVPGRWWFGRGRARSGYAVQTPFNRTFYFYQVGASLCKRCSPSR